jgi:tetratricopeptide (TPR) repeat protein
MMNQADIIEFRQKVKEAIGIAKFDKPLGRLVPLMSRRVTLMAASVTILILIAATVYFLVPKTYSNSRLFSMYYDSENPIHITRSGSSNLVEAVRYYQQKNYPVAIQLFKEILKNDQDNSAIRFYMAISEIETRQNDDAIAAFREIISESNNLYVESAKWYLGLCLLKTNQNDLALKQFSEIAADEHSSYKSEAAKIVKQLRKSQ